MGWIVAESQKIRTPSLSDFRSMNLLTRIACFGKLFWTMLKMIRAILFHLQVNSKLRVWRNCKKRGSVRTLETCSTSNSTAIHTWKLQFLLIFWLLNQFQGSQSIYKFKHQTQHCLFVHGLVLGRG